MENLPGNIWPIDGPTNLNVFLDNHQMSLPSVCARQARLDQAWRSALWWHRMEAVSRDDIRPIRSLQLPVTSCPGVSTEKVD